jgi:hypothetical protein
VDEGRDHCSFRRYKNIEYMTFMLFSGLNRGGTGAGLVGTVTGVAC